MAKKRLRVDPVAADRPFDEAACARALARGEEAALRLAMGRWGDVLYGLLLRCTGSRDDADDLFQELWLRVVRAAPTIDPDRSLGGWLHRIALNLVRDAARREAACPWQPSVDGTVPETTDPTPAPDAVVAAGQEAAALRRAIARLPERQREVLLLRWIEELSEREVAEAMGIPPGTVKSRLHHALRNLRAALGRREGEEVAR